MKPFLLILPLVLFCMPRPAAPSAENRDDATRVLTSFDEDTAADRWSVEDDTVMGGRSEGHAEVTDEGHLRFWGDVSLENDGGFSSVQSKTDKVYDLDGYSSFQIRLKGDGSNYNFRVKRDRDERHSYTFEFPTKGEWETISIPFDAMKPVFRGRQPDVPSFAGEDVKQLRFLIGNKKEQSFELVVDEISVL